MNITDTQEVINVIVAAVSAVVGWLLKTLFNHKKN